MTKKKVMLITGTSSGIGNYLARYYSTKGYLVIGCSRKPSNFKEKNYRHFCLDITDESQVRDLFRQVQASYGRLDVLISNAGKYFANINLLTSLEDVRSVFETNVFGAFLICREAAKMMKENQYGRIVGISSIAVNSNARGTSVYSASKRALEQFTQVLARELAEDKITVNVLALSYVDRTGMVEKLSDKARSDVLESTVFNLSLKREDVSHAMDFLISPKSRMLTSHTLRIGGF